MKKSKASDRDYGLWAVLSQTAHAVERLRSNELRKAGITMLQAEILNLVNESEGPIIPTEIARLTFRERHTISEVLDRMQEDGLMEKVKDLKRRNRVRVVLTKKGEDACRRSAGGDVILRTMSGLSQEDCAGLRGYLEVWRDKAFEELANSPRPFGPF